MDNRGRVRSKLDPALLLTVHQIEILTGLATGSRGGEISARLGIRIDTIYEEIENLRHRFGARSNPQLIRLAIAHGFVDAS
jgi:DNA-binding NarL/FixJ family response regulator